MNGAIALSAVDWIVVALCVSAIVVAGLTGKRGNKDSAVQYILAGRRLTTPVFAASLIVTWYGSVMGSGEFVARYGITYILCFGVPYYLAAALYAWLLSKRIRKNDAVSVPDLIRRMGGKQAGIAAAIAMLFISIPAPFMLSIGLLLSGLAGFTPTAGVIVGSAIALLIVAKGGLASDVRANVVQVVLMYSGFIALFVFCLMQWGGPNTLWNALPAIQKDVPGILGWQAVAVWLLIALQTFVDPNFHVRAAASKTPQIAQRGLLLSIVGWMVFDSLQLFIGLYASTFAPSVNPVNTFLTAANVAMPVAWKGLFIASILGTIMSSLDGYALVSATTIGHDIIDQVQGRGSRQSSLYVGLTLTGFIGIVGALLIPSVVDLIYNAASVTVPALLFPLIFATRTSFVNHRTDIPSTTYVLWIVLPAAAAITMFAVNGVWKVGIEPMIVGLITSAVALLTIRIKYGIASGK